MFLNMLRFQPKEGSIVFCNYKGFSKPEMVKNRPVIIVHKHRSNSKLVAVVPISTTKASNEQNFHIELDAGFSLINLDGKQSWIKCDMINVVSIERLNLVRDTKRGIRHAPCIDTEYFRQIKDTVRLALKL